MLVLKIIHPTSSEFLTLVSTGVKPCIAVRKAFPPISGFLSSNDCDRCNFYDCLKRRSRDRSNARIIFLAKTEGPTSLELVAKNYEF